MNAADADGDRVRGNDIPIDDAILNNNNGNDNVRLEGDQEVPEAMMEPFFDLTYRLVRQSFVWQSFAAVVAEVFPMFTSMETFRESIREFRMGLREAPCLTLFAAFFSFFIIFPIFSLIAFTTAVFLLTLVWGLMTFIMVFVFGFLGFAASLFVLMLFACGASLFFGSILETWRNWPSISRDLQSVKQGIYNVMYDKMADYGFVCKREVNGVVLRHQDNLDDEQELIPEDGGNDDGEDL